MDARSLITIRSFPLPAWAWRLAALGWAAAMAWACLQEASGAAPGWWRLPHIDKLAHAGMHGLLAWLLWRGARRASLGGAMGVVLLCAAFGLAIEWGQAQFTLTRSAEALDALANTLGAMLGVTLGLRPAGLVSQP
jgi:VanZ family protein